MNRKIALISLIVICSLIIGYTIYRGVQKSGIVKRLVAAYKNPDSQEALGGFKKLVSAGVFDPTIYQKKGKTTISLLEAREIAKRIWDAYSWMGSDQTTIVNAFNGLGHINDVSKITHEFNESYDRDLIEVLESAVTDKSNMNSLIGKINKLPKN